jgi:hypothetical protein
VTITKSQWFNNGAGIVPNALDSEKYAPPEDNVITDNDIFWHNFNYYAGAPLKLKKQATSAPYPIGVGVLLFGGRRTEVSNNRIYGNYLIGVGALKQILLKQTDAADLIGHQVHHNQFGLGGADLNGRELFYDGTGTDNCFGSNVGVQTTTPADGSAFNPCPFTGANTFNQVRPERGDQLERGRSHARGVLAQAPPRLQERPHAAGALQEVRFRSRSG